MKERSYKILEVGNIFFPVKDKGKKFKIINTVTIDLPINKKEFQMCLLMLNKYKKYHDLGLFFIVKELWREICKQKLNENCDWITVCDMKVDEKSGSVEVIIDLLKEVK